MCWDEGYYFPAYEDAREWVSLLFAKPGDALSSKGIELGWREIHELPPVTKWIGVIGSLLVTFASPEWKLFLLRLPTAFVFGATVAVIAVIVTRQRSLRAGLFTAFVYGMHPRIFGHGHFAASETPMVFLVVCFTAVALQCRRACRRIPLLAVLAGLTLATKVNALIFLAGVGLWYCSRAWLTSTAEPARAWKRDIGEAALVISGAFVVAFLIWPWMWDDTGHRIAGYWRFIREHSHQGVWYLGERWNFPDGAPRVPWHYPFILTLVGSPLVWLMFGAAGAAGFAGTLKRSRFRLENADLLLLLLVAGPIAAQTLPSTPKYDSLRLFLPAFAPATILAGLHIGPGFPAGTRKWLAPLAAVLLLLEFPGDRGLGFYNAPSRWVAAKGPHEFSFEVTYWNEGLTRPVLDDLQTIYPHGDVSIRPLAMHGAVLEIQKQWGIIPDRFVFDTEPPYDGHLLQNRQGFWGRSEWWYAAERDPLAWWPPDADPASGRPPLVYLYDGLPPGVQPDSQPLTSITTPSSVAPP